MDAIKHVSRMIPSDQLTSGQLDWLKKQCFYSISGGFNRGSKKDTGKIHYVCGYRIVNFPKKLVSFHRTYIKLDLPCKPIILKSLKVLKKHVVRKCMLVPFGEGEPEFKLTISYEVH